MSVSSTLARELKDILEALRERKKKSRKEALDKLNVVFSNEGSVAQLDALTFGVPPRDQRTLGYATEYVSWTAILTALMDGVQEDVSRSLNKGVPPDSIYSQVVRMVVNKATGQRERTLYSMLEPVSLNLMSHLSFILERTFAFRQSSQVYNDYSTTLKFLLENDRYDRYDTYRKYDAADRGSVCAFSTYCMDADDFASTLKPLCKMILQNVDGSREDNATASFMVKDLTVLRSVLAHMKYDMEPETRAMLMEILRRFGQGGNLREWTSRICNEVVGLCVQTMLYCRGDAMHVLAEITEQFHHSAMLLLREGNPEGREAALVYFRAATRLELLELRHVKDVVDWYQGIDLDGSWLRSPECAEYGFNREQSLLALLLADLEVSMYRRLSRDALAGLDLDSELDVMMGINGHGSNATANATAMGRKRKRQNRRLGFDLVSDAVRQPAALGPVACMFLLKHGSCLASKDFEGACGMIADEVKGALQHSFVSEHVKPDVVWILRMLYAAVVTESSRAATDDSRTTTNAHSSLGSAISFLIQQFKVLSSYPVTRDVVKMIVIAALPRLHDSIRLGNSSYAADSFRQELLSETPSAMSIVLVTLLLRYKKLSTLSKPVVCLYIDWITKAVTLQGSPAGPVSSDVVCTALCTLMFGGDTTGVLEVEGHVAALEDQYRWWRETDVDLGVDDLPPVSSWSMYGALRSPRSTGMTTAFASNAVASPASQHAVVAVDGAVTYLRDVLETILESCVLEDDTLNVSTLCLDLMSRVNKGDPRSGDVDMADGGGDAGGGHAMRFGSLQSFMSKCIAWITTRVMTCSTLHKSNYGPISRFADALSRLCESDKEEVRGIVADLPSLEDALNNSMAAKGDEDDGVGRVSQPHGRSGPITGGARDRSDTDRRIPMLQWYLDVLERTSCYNPARALEDLSMCYKYFTENKYFLPLEVRVRMAALESSCILSTLALGDVPPPGLPEEVHFLEREKGLFSYDHEFVFRNGIFEGILLRGFAMVKQASFLGDTKAAKVCMSSVSSQLFQLIEESITVKTSAFDRIMVADMIVGLMEVDSSLVPGAMFEPLVEWLATLIVDRYSVRVAAASILPRLLDFFSDPRMLFQKILEMLPLQSNQDEDKIIPIDCDLDELLRTVVLTLGTVASKIPALELICVSCLIQELQYEGVGIDNGDGLEGVAMNEATMDALRYIAESLGYDSVKSYLTVMSRSIVVHMMQDPKRAVFCMEKYLLACRLAGADGVPGKEVLLAFLVYHRSATGVNSLMEYVKVKHFPLILRQSMGDVCAAHFFASGAHHADIDALLSGVSDNLTSMASLLRADLDLESLMAGISDEIIINTIGHGSSEFDTQQGAEESKVFTKEVCAVKDLAERLALDGHPGGSMPRPVDIMMLLMGVQRKISDFKHPRHKVQAVRAATCAILYVKPSLDNPGILRQALAIVSILMRYTTTSEPACEILVHVIDHVVCLQKAADYEKLIQTIGITLPTIMSYMCDSYYASTHASPESPESPEHHVVRCIRYLMLNRAKPYVFLRKHTTVLDPRIDKMLGEDGSLGAGTSVKNYLDAFGELVSLLSPSTRLEYITLIRQKMTERPRADPLNPPTPDFIAEKSLWKIVHAASLNQDDRCLVDFAGQLVSYFGPLKPNVLSFNPSQYGALTERHETPGRLTLASAVDILEIDTYRGALLLLYDYLVEDDSQAAAEAFVILQEILSTNSGVSAFNMLDNMVQEHLNLFLQSKMGDPDEEDGSAFSMELNDRLWKLDGGPGGSTGDTRASVSGAQAIHSARYDEWITGIGHDVLSKSNNTVLTSCAKLAKMRANFVEVLLPLVFVHISLDKDASAKVATVLGNLITEHVLPHFGTYPKAANVLLRVLHSLRRLYNVDKEAAESGQASDLPSPCLSWKTMYWVTVDYLALGEACVASRSLYSGIIFGEMWREARISKAKSAEFQRYERLMQELYALLPEPDGLYALTRANDAMSQLRRFEREGDWARAMVICDLALQMEEENPDVPVLNIPREHALSCMRRCLGNLGSSYLMAGLGGIEGMGMGESHLDAAPGAGLNRITGTSALCQSLSGPIFGPKPAVTAPSPAAIALGEWYPMQSSNDSAGSEAADPQLASAMKHFRIGYAGGFTESLHSVRNEVIGLLASASRETTADLNPLIVKAQMAECIAEAWNIKWQVDPKERDAEVDANVASWKLREAVAGAGWRFSLEMPIKDLRNELLQIIGREDLKAHCLLDIAVCARKADRNGQALGALSRFRRSLETSQRAARSSSEHWSHAYRVSEANWRIEEAKNLWAQKQRDAAINSLLANSMSIINDVETNKRELDSDNIVSVAYLNCLLAKWMAITQTESSQTILDTLAETTQAIETTDWAAADPATSDKACRIFYRMASYANQLRNEIAQRKLSVEWVKAKSILEKNKREMEEIESKLEGSKKQSRDQQILLVSKSKLNKTIVEDAQAIDSAEVNELEYDTLAIRHYCLSLRHGSRYDLPATFRLVDRWLSPRPQDQSDQVNLVFREESADVPSHKLMALGYQLASRLSDSRNKDTEFSLFQDNLKATLFKMAKEHPFHMLPILFALKNGDKTKDFPGSRGGTGMAFQANASRIAAASALIDKVQGLDQRMKTIVSELDCATQGYIEIAMSDFDSKARLAPFPAKWRRKFCKELCHIPLLSVLLPFDLTLAYDDLPTIASIDEKMSFPGGINRPKLVTIVDSRGQTRRQLVKGKDDLRQDAVMEQYFRICNAFFQEAKSTASRNLAIGTYFALPFSPSSGLLEWIDDTESLEGFITDGNRKYHRLRSEVFVKLAEVQSRKGYDKVPLKVKLDLFKRCVEELGPPRMGRVFLRRFADPGRWFEARLAYTRSVAVNSMAGHIIGLGDRHLSNILLSKATADVIHIDLGIAFEQGKLLSTPEQVPFRLTRNMVDAMGAPGVEGVMRRCCEEVLRVMRKHKDPIVTVLSVFIHDPLYSWSLSHERIGKSGKTQQAAEGSGNDGDGGDNDNGSEVDEGNVSATRTLLVIKDKLEGIIGGDTTARGVEGQVQHLLSEAVQEENLCRMWRGWQAHI